GDEAAITQRRAARHHSHAAINRDALERVSVLVVEAELIIDGEVFQPPHAKAERDTLLDPEVDVPLLTLSLGGAHFAGVEPLLEFIEDRDVLIGELGGRVIEELLNLFCQFHSVLFKRQSVSTCRKGDQEGTTCGPSLQADGPALRDTDDSSRSLPRGAAQFAAARELERLQVEADFLFVSDAETVALPLFGLRTVGLFLQLLF